MPPPSSHLGVLFLLLVVTLLSACGPSQPHEVHTFQETYRRLHNAGKADELYDLIAFAEGVPPATRQHARLALREESRWPLRSITIQPATPEDLQNLLPKGATLPYPPEYTVTVTLDTSDRLTSQWLAAPTPQGLRLLLPALR
jgi:hypothetical protein